MKNEVKMKIVFFGSDDFAEINLRKLLSSGQCIEAVVTQPDKAKGRGLKIGMSPVKVCALENGLDILQPTDFHEVSLIKKLQSYQSDLFVVIAYGRKLPIALLNIPRLSAINVHASLLPKYRGAAPINWVIIKGEKETGVSVIKMTPVMDGGDIINQKKIKIEDNDTAITLRKKLAELGADCLCETIRLLKDGKFSVSPQAEKEVTLAPKLKKEIGQINWSAKAFEIHNLVKGLLPWPTAHTFFNGKIVKILETAVVATKMSGHLPGEVLGVSADGIIVATGHDGLLLQQVLPESSKEMSASSFAVGHSVTKGVFLGK